MALVLRTFDVSSKVLPRVRLDSACIVAQSPARQTNDIQGDAFRVFGPCDPKATQWRQGEVRYEILANGPKSCEPLVLKVNDILLAPALRLLLS